MQIDLIIRSTPSKLPCATDVDQEWQENTISAARSSWAPAARYIHIGLRVRRGSGYKLAEVKPPTVSYCSQWRIQK